MISREEAYQRARIKQEEIELNNRRTDEQAAKELVATLEKRIEKAINEGKFGLVHQCRVNERVLTLVRDSLPNWDFTYPLPVNEKKDTIITIGWGKDESCY